MIEEGGTARYLNELRKTASPTTVRRKLSAFRVYAKSNGIQPYLEDYVAPIPPRPKPHPIPEGMDGVDLLVAACEDMEEVSIIVLTFMCGLRIAEALRVTPASIDTADLSLTIRGKGDKTRTIAVSERAAILLSKRVLELGPHGQNTPLIGMIDRTARRRFTKIGERANLSRRIKSHDGRHTIATHLMRQGTPMRVVQEFLGHASITQTEAYTGVELYDMRIAVNM